jgi:signal transduction histidine kinase
MFDWRQMQRWGISESSLPPGSEIQFRDLSVWDQYRTPIVAVIAALLLQTALITWLVYEHRRRQIAEAQSLQRVNELARMNRFATAGELSASIAHEVRQPLSAISISGEAGLRWLKPQSRRGSQGTRGRYRRELSRRSRPAECPGDVQARVDITGRSQCQ